MAYYLPLKRALAALFLLGLFCFYAMPAAHADTGPIVASLQTITLDATLPDMAVPQKDIERLRLSDQDAATYAKMFAAQQRGQKVTAEALAKKLNDTSLVDWTKVRAGRLSALWLPDMPGTNARVYQSPLKRTAAQKDAAHDIALSVSVLLKTDDIDRALGVAQRALMVGTIERVEAAQLYAQIAAAHLYAAQTPKALALAHLALQIGGVKVPNAAWIAGLASWAEKDYARAAKYFAWVPQSVYAGPWMRSAAAYWTARALTRQGQYQNVSAWLTEAARNPRSFYGLIATRALGTRFDFNWTVPPFTKVHLSTLKKYPGAVRALKLAQAGQMDMARIELTLLDEAAAPQWREALAALAVGNLKPDVAMKVAGVLQAPDGRPLDMALYPVAPWQPKDGYRLDPALIHAFVRQESGFKPSVTNKTSGATGLLQLLPRTARTLDKSLDRDTLKNPQVSMALGQKYIEDLLDMTDGNLFEAAIAYNAGPGNLNIWKGRFANVDDPLLFIELVPFGETRAYVERVMANYWIYSLRMGLGVATLDAVAAGAPARYASYNKATPQNIYASVSTNNR